jgi:hypothetical protein
MIFLIPSLLVMNKAPVTDENKTFVARTLFRKANNQPNKEIAFNELDDDLLAYLLPENDSKLNLYLNSLSSNNVQSLNKGNYSTQEKVIINKWQIILCSYIFKKSSLHK